MHFSILTLFPDMVRLFFDYGLMEKARKHRIINVDMINIRDFSNDKHMTVDDRPFGGGCGMVMKPEPMARAIASARQRLPDALTVLLTPQGKRFNQEAAQMLSEFPGLILICCRYEGPDERILDKVDIELSVGDYILMGGELPAMIVMESITRLLPGALGGIDSATKDSFSDGLIEHAHYTRPHDFEGQAVPETLLSGNHRLIEKWRKESSIIRTFLKRPDLLSEKHLPSEELDYLILLKQRLETFIDTQRLHGPGSLSGRQ